MEKRVMMQLEGLRKKMNELADKKGLDHPEVLMISQQIDELHNKFNRFHYDSSKKHQSTIYRLRRNIKIKESRNQIYAYLYAASVI